MCVAWCQRSPLCHTPSPWWSSPWPWAQCPASTSSAAAAGPFATSSLERQRSSPRRRTMREWGVDHHSFLTKKCSFQLTYHYCDFFYTTLPLLTPTREHRFQEGKVTFPLGVSVQGDVVVSVYHMRSTIGGRLQAKVVIWNNAKKTEHKINCFSTFSTFYTIE